MKKQPNKLLAPIVIAGVTIGFLASAYKFVFAQSGQKKPAQPEVDSENLETNSAEQSQPSSKE